MKNKSLVKNSIYNVAYKLLNVLFPLITATYIARVLLATGVGLIAYSQNVVAYFVTFASLGIPNYGIREIARSKNYIEKRNKIFSELFIINFISTSFCLILYYVMISLFPFFHQHIDLYKIMGLMLIFNLFNVDWFYQGEEEFRYITHRSFLIKILSMILMFAFVKDKTDVENYALILCFAVGGNNILNIFNLRKHNVRLEIKNLNFIIHLKPVLYLMASVIAIEIYTMLDTTMIGSLGTAEQVGYYSNSMKLVKILISVVTAIGGVLLPRLSYYKELGKIDECSKIVSRVFEVMLFLFVPAQIALLILSKPIIIILFGNSFIPAATTLTLTSLLICGLGFSNLFGTQVLLTFNAERKLLFATIVGAVINVVLNLFLIPQFAQNGAAVASVLSEIVVTIICINNSLKYIKLIIQSRFILSLFISNLLLCILLMVIRLSNLSSLLMIIFAILAFVLIYIPCNVLLKNPILSQLFQILLKRGR